MHLQPIFFDHFRQIGSRCISALFVKKVGLTQTVLAHAFSGGSGGGGGGWLEPQENT